MSDNLRRYRAIRDALIPLIQGYRGQPTGLAARHLTTPHSIGFSGRVCPRSSKASRGEDLEIEEPVCSGYSSAFHFYATLPGMHSPTLIRDEVVQMREPREKRLLVATGMMEPFHRE